MKEITAQFKMNLKPEFKGRIHVKEIAEQTTRVNKIMAEAKRDQNIMKAFMRIENETVFQIYEIKEKP